MKAGHVVEVTHPEKILFPDDGITKGELVAYYKKIADVMVPLIRGRPVMMQRFPNGIGGFGFYQKEAGDFPAWIHKVKAPKIGGEVTHVVCDDADSLAYIANQNCITPHVWLSRADRLEYPDQLMFDLDPSGDDFSDVRAAAKQVRRLLDELGLPSFLKTTGSRGVHVAVPIRRTGTFDDVGAFADRVAAVLVARDPDHLTTEFKKANRQGRVLIDVWRNRYAQTAVAPYAVRAHAGAPVSTPITWEELDATALTPQRYTIRNIFRLLGRRPDPWADMSRQARGLKDAASRLASLA
jgi:bifunctional non-homologous end joining protein LigD